MKKEFYCRVCNFGEFRKKREVHWRLGSPLLGIQTTSAFDISAVSFGSRTQAVNKVRFNTRVPRLHKLMSCLMSETQKQKQNPEHKNIKNACKQWKLVSNINCWGIFSKYECTTDIRIVSSLRGRKKVSICLLKQVILRLCYTLCDYYIMLWLCYCYIVFMPSSLIFRYLFYYLFLKILKYFLKN